jgi:L-threonylcarbamoyladenylate synthase
LILIAGEINQLEEFVDFSMVKNLKTVFHSWPGPVTWLIPARRTTPAWLTGEHNTLAVRVSSYDLIKSLCAELGPIISTSANPHNRPPARSSQRVRAYFPREIDYVIPAKIANNQNPSEIRDAQTGNILRSG